MCPFKIIQPGLYPSSNTTLSPSYPPLLQVPLSQRVSYTLLTPATSKIDHTQTPSVIKTPTKVDSFAVIPTVTISWYRILRNVFVGFEFEWLRLYHQSVSPSSLRFILVLLAICICTHPSDMTGNVFAVQWSATGRRRSSSVPHPASPRDLPMEESGAPRGQVQGRSTAGFSTSGCRVQSKLKLMRVMSPTTRQRYEALQLGK